MAKILVTGGTGFVGGYVIDELLTAGHDVTALVRPGETPARLEGKNVKQAIGNVLLYDGLEDACRGCGVVIHLVGIIREMPGAGFEQVHVKGVENMIQAAKACGIKRFIHMSALGTRPDGVSRYHKTKWRGEEAVRASGLPYVIIRPSVIFGPGDEFMTKLKSLFSNPLFVPSIGSGKAQMQPVYAGDVAACYAKAAVLPGGEINRVFELGGPEKFTVPQLLELIGKHIGKMRLVLRIPLRVMKPIVRIIERITDNPPVTSDQLIMLEENNITDSGDMEKVFEIAPTSLRDIIPIYL